MERLWSVPDAPPAPLSPWREKLHSIAGYVLDLLLPPRCVGCGRVGSWFCDRCMAAVEPVPEPVCPLCGRPTLDGEMCAFCRRNPPHLNGVRSVALFKEPLRSAIHALKYKGRKEVAVPLGRMMADYLSHPRETLDFIVPVPLHPERRKERGYNQAALLAAGISRQTGVPMATEVLVRSRYTKPQVTLNARERMENVKDAFECVDAAVQGKRVILVDDVCTTGATMDAAAQALWKCHPERVWGLTLARAVWDVQAVPAVLDMKQVRLLPESYGAHGRSGSRIL